MTLIPLFLQPIVWLLFCLCSTALFATSTQTLNKLAPLPASDKILFQYFQQQQSSIEDLQANLEVLREAVFELTQENSLLKKKVESLSFSHQSSLSIVENEPLKPTSTTSNTSTESTASVIEPYPSSPVPQNLQLGVSFLESESSNTAEPTQQSSSETILYDSAFQQLTKNNLTEATELFIQQVTLFPEGALMGDALFWLGELYFSQHEYLSALSFFQQLQKKFPNHAKQPEVLYKTGFSLIKLERQQEGKKVLNQLIYAFPNASSARLAQKELSILE